MYWAIDFTCYSNIRNPLGHIVMMAQNEVVDLNGICTRPACFFYAKGGPKPPAHEGNCWYVAERIQRDAEAAALKARLQGEANAKQRDRGFFDITSDLYNLAVPLSCKHRAQAHPGCWKVTERTRGDAQIIDERHTRHETYVCTQKNKGLYDLTSEYGVFGPYPTRSE